MRTFDGRLKTFVLAFASVMLVSACNDEVNVLGSACNNITCGGHGVCRDDTGTALCQCDDGYVVDPEYSGNCIEAGTTSDVCKDVTCGGHGVCRDNSGTAACLCESGYIADPQNTANCIEDGSASEVCKGVTCGGHGICGDNAGAPACQCETGYHIDPENELNCVEDEVILDPCQGVTCSGHGTCSNSEGKSGCQCESGYHADPISATECLEDFSCGDHEIEKYGACACNDEANYYGAPGSCQLCSGDHKVIVGDACICDTGYEDDGNGGCKLICGEGEKESNGACICDNGAKYYGEPGSCASCEGTGKIIKDNACICDPDKNLIGDAQSLECACDYTKNYYGTAGDCKVCGENKIIVPISSHSNSGYLNTQCICSAAEGYEDDGNGGCKKIAECVVGATRCTIRYGNSVQTCQNDGQWGDAVFCNDNRKICNSHPKTGKDACVCDVTNMWTYDESGECICRASNHWKSDGKGGCECNSAEGYKSDGKGGCACSYPYYLKNGVCTKCKYTILGSTACINQVGDVISFGKYPQSGSTAEPIKWRVLDIDTSSNHSVMLFSEKVLDMQKYYNVTDHSKSKSKWLPSDLRTWLNNDFRMKAFDSIERSRINLAKHLSTGNFQYTYKSPYKAKNDEGANTDNVDLLSFGEVYSYLTTNTSRKATATAYAQEQGKKLGAEHTCWGTRTPLADTGDLHSFSCIDYSGGYEQASGKDTVLTSEYAHLAVGIRPVVWVQYE
ncbi:MAG: hypothetical protein IKY83_03825 [Proteobacteria bacterium]|nr:hypothetical protein [Pseudomonadota bacterium]